MSLVDQAFADTFTFGRAVAAEYRNAVGAIVTAPIDTPRFDHDAGGTALGLLVEGRPDVTAPDRLKLRAGDWTAPRGTVLHEYMDTAGQVVRCAWYSAAQAGGAVNGCLNIAGRHRRIAFVPTYLKNRGGYVRWRRRDYALGGLLLTSTGAALAVSSDILILEG